MDHVEDTSNLIAGAKVAGADVYTLSGDQIGRIQDVMIDESSGKIAYAVMSFGGFLGLGAEYHALPWPLLKYDVGLGGYVVNVAEAQREGAPTVPRDSELDGSHLEYESEVHRLYGVGPYWTM